MFSAFEWKPIQWLPVTFLPFTLKTKATIVSRSIWSVTQFVIILPPLDVTTVDLKDVMEKSTFSYIICRSTKIWHLVLMNYSLCTYLHFTRLIWTNIHNCKYNRTFSFAFRLVFCCLFGSRGQQFKGAAHVQARRCLTSLNVMAVG